MRPDPQLIIWLMLCGIAMLAYWNVKDSFYIRDLENAIKSSPDAQHFLKELARKRQEAAQALADRMYSYGPRCSECHQPLGLRANDRGLSERKCVNRKCPTNQSQ